MALDDLQDEIEAEDSEIEDVEIPGEQGISSGTEKKPRGWNLAPWQYKKGQSGNPSGRAPGTKSLKEYAKERLASMTDSEREEFLSGLGKSTIWRMAEGNPANYTDITSGGKPIVTLAEEIVKKNDINASPETNSN